MSEPNLKFKVKGDAVNIPIFTRTGKGEAREKGLLESPSLGRLKLCKLVGGCDQCAFLCLPSLKRPAAWRCGCAQVITHDLDKSRLPNRARKTKITNEESKSQV